ncbi:MAG: hypothetical protein ABIH67_00715 [Candidatus Uhrbacteria bacterium]
MSETRQHEYRDWYAEFSERPIKVSPKKLDKELGGYTIIACDGSKHRQLISGAYDLLVDITPCDGSCQDWQEKKGSEIREDIPNLSDKWFTSDEDTDNRKMIKVIM